MTVLGCSVFFGVFGVLGVFWRQRSGLHWLSNRLHTPLGCNHRAQKTPVAPDGPRQKTKYKSAGLQPRKSKGALTPWGSFKKAYYNTKQLSNPRPFNQLTVQATPPPRWDSKSKNFRSEAHFRSEAYFRRRRISSFLLGRHCPWFAGAPSSAAGIGWIIPLRKLRLLWSLSWTGCSFVICVLHISLRCSCLNELPDLCIAHTRRVSHPACHPASQPSRPPATLPASPY
jgi:hypothetical protein